jgi:glutaredoxin
LGVRSAVRALVLALALVVTLVACRKPPPAIAAELPVVRDDTKGLSYTFVDQKGDYHVVDTPAEVPQDARAFVRVMDPSHDPPEGSVFVTDLTQKSGDGAYTVRVVTREELDALAVQRRKAIGPTIAMNGQTAAAGGDAGAAGAAGSAGSVAMAPQVIIYGAEWCGACHQAAAYLTKKGVRFVEKDIEKDAGAEREMNAKLAKAGLAGGGIPVIDVGGKVMVGFLPAKVDAALARMGTPI